MSGIRTALTSLAGIAAFAAFSGAVAQEEDATVSVAESETFGSYLVGPEGKPLYMFTTDTQGGEDSAPQVSCSGECLDAWPLVTVEGEATAGSGADGALLSTFDHEGEMVASYNGWPLYTFARDTAGEEPQGQDVESFGGEWYLLGPDGEMIEEEGEG